MCSSILADVLPILADVPFPFRYGDPDKSVTQRLFYSLICSNSTEILARSSVCAISVVGSFGGVIIFGGECTITLVD
jgi:hypothetical protein